ncbi:RNase H domain-containing protein [Mycena venus]|uniref:RNase H domain-containing protein n=1 Tax=Mycena venus TaxID=2733690 RepID=A0A8H7DG14_9AGAR|nr:RNase H domain-containing protein [Mycena venus]
MAEAFRLTSVHKLAQIKQIATSNLPTRVEAASGKTNGPVQRNVDWCSTFGNCGSPRIWASVMGLIIWIAIFVKHLPDIFCYVDNTYSWEIKNKSTYYPPYKKYLPTKQAQLLFLWDFLGIQHKEKKQIHGASLPIIGFEIDPNTMTAKLPPDSKADLEKWVQEFIDTPSRRCTLREFQCLTGWINWSLNMYFLLCPALSNVYDKMSGKCQPHAGIYINKAIRNDLSWFLNHLRKSNGILFFAALDWNPLTEADITVSSPPIPGDPPANTIFFFEALCVISALRWNTVNIFSSLCATPNYNHLLCTAVDDLIEHNVDLRVLHIKGEDNYIADAISRQRFDNAIEPVKSRQPAREAWTLERLVHMRAVAMGAAIDTSSAPTYGSALNSFIEFCCLHRFPIEPTAETLSFYVVFMCHHIRPDSVDSYLSGICNQLEAHFPNVREIRKGMLVSRTLQGCKRLRGTAVRRKLLLSRDHLRQAITALPSSPSHDDLLFLSQLFTGFRALLRLGELTMPDNPKLQNPRKYSKRASAVLQATSYEYWLPAHKADTTFEGSHILITDTDALTAFRTYLNSRDHLHPLNPYLWILSNGKVPTRAWFMRKLRHLFPDTNIAGQSMRAGGATALAEDGAPPHVIQASGRWAFNTFQIYIRKHPVLLQAMLHSRL